MTTKIYIVRLIKPFKGTNMYVFGSVSAIFDTIPWQQVGITERKLRDIEKVCSVGYYENQNCTITQSILLRKRKTPRRNVG